MTADLAGPQVLERDRRTWALYLLTGYFAYLQTVLGPIIPFVRADQDIGYGIASLHFGAFAAGGIATGLLGPRLVRRFGVRASIWAGGVGMAAGTLVLVAGTTTLLTIVGTLVMGLLGALLLISAQKALADHHPGNGAVVLLESNVAASTCAIVGAASVGLFERLEIGWRGAPALAIVGFAALAAWFKGTSFETYSRAAERSDGSGRLPAGFWVLMSLLFLGAGTEWCFAYWGADFLVGSGVQPGVAATSLSSFFAAMVVGRLIGSRLARRIDDFSLLTAALLVALGGFFVFWSVDGIVVRLVGLFVSGVGISNIYPVVIAAGAKAAHPHTGLATGRLAVAGSSAVLIAPVVLGGLADMVGLAQAFAIVIPMLVISVALARMAGLIDS